MSEGKRIGVPMLRTVKLGSVRRSGERTSIGCTKVWAQQQMQSSSVSGVVAECLLTSILGVPEVRTFAAVLTTEQGLLGNSHVAISVPMRRSSITAANRNHLETIPIASSYSS
jgi:hypothetical protein